MSFSKFLNEGLISLPPKTTEKMIKNFVYWYLVYLTVLMSRQPMEDEDDIDSFEISIERLAKKFDVKEPSESDIGKLLNSNVRSIFTKFEVTDLPQNYIERVMKIKELDDQEKKKLKSVNVKFMLTFAPHPLLDGQGIFYPGDDENDPLIIISIYNMKIKANKVVDLLKALKFNEAARIINHAIGIVEHEISHAVQHLVLWLLHPSQFIPGETGKAVKTLRSELAKRDKYYTSKTEFGPWVRSSIRELNNLFDEKNTKDPAHQRDIFSKFTYSDVSKDKIRRIPENEHGRSLFFRSLKRSDPDGWSKAVKLLMKEVFK